MVTDNTDSSAMFTPHSEYPLKNWQPLQPNFELHSDSNALWVEGIGYLAQYDYYYDKLYSHGVIYFLRDTLYKEITAKTDSGAKVEDLQLLIQRLDTLNSKIRVYEQSQCQSNGC